MRTETESGLSPSPLRVGLAGCGRVAERFYLPAFARLATESDDALRLAAVADPRAEGRERAARGGVRAFSSAAELLESGLVDAVVVATPAETHAEVAGRVLRAGLPVLVEKPLARTVAEGETLRDASRAAGAPLMAGFNRRHWAPVRTLAAALREADGAPGVPFRARLVFDTDTSAWAPATQLGDALEDLVSHQLDLLRHLFRREIQSIRAEPGDAGRASVSVRLEGDVEAECRASQQARYREVVLVRRGGSRWVVRAGSDRIAPPGGPVRAALDAADRVRRRLGRRTPALARSFDLQLLAFADFVRRGVRPEPGIEDGLAVLRAVEAARRSAAGGGVEERP